MITVIGLGFVGLTTGLGFAAKGFKVYGYDIDIDRLNTLRNGQVSFYEPQIQQQLIANLGKNFNLVSSLEEAIGKSNFIFFCVGTPSHTDGSVDLLYLNQALNQVANIVERNSGKIFVVKSTVPPTTFTKQIIPLLEAQGLKVGEDVGLVNNPEFLREGSAWDDFNCPDRIVIGGVDNTIATQVGQLYKSFNAPLFYVTPTTAEFIKYLSNTLLATLISFSNEMSLLAEAFSDIDIPKAFRILHKDRRWSGDPANIASYVFPGFGFGGSCLPKDVKALAAKAQENGKDPILMLATLEINRRIKEAAAVKIMQVVKSNEMVGILGLAFKPNTDDVRESPAKDIIKTLLDKGYTQIVAYDPMASVHFDREYGLDIQYAASIEALVKQVSIVVILTGWSVFAENKEFFEGKKVLDFRNIL